MSAPRKAKKARNPWVQIAHGIRSGKILESPAATSRRIERNIQRDTLGLGHWSEPADWHKLPFSHTVTMVTDRLGMVGGWQLYNNGVVVTLAVHPIEGPFERGAAYVWCKRVHDIGGGGGEHPTAPIFGRFLSWANGSPTALVGKAQSAVLGAEYVYCFRAVGTGAWNTDLYTRSEVPVPVPSDAEWNQQPAEFDVLQHHVKALDQLLQNMADIDDMVDELDDAEKKAGNADDWQAAACRRARAYKALQPILTAAMRKSDEVEIQLAEFLKAAPKLARRLAHWQSEGAT